MRILHRTLNSLSTQRRRERGRCPSGWAPKTFCSAFGAAIAKCNLPTTELWGVTEGGQGGGGCTWATPVPHTVFWGGGGGVTKAQEVRWLVRPVVRTVGEPRRALLVGTSRRPPLLQALALARLGPYGAPTAWAPFVGARTTLRRTRSRGMRVLVPLCPCPTLPGGAGGPVRPPRALHRGERRVLRPAHAPPLYMPCAVPIADRHQRQRSVHCRALRKGGRKNPPSHQETGCSWSPSNRCHSPLRTAAGYPQPPSVPREPRWVPANRRWSPPTAVGSRQPPSVPPNRRRLPPTAVGYPPTALGYPPTAVGYPPTAAGYPPTAVGYPPTAAGYPPTAVGPRQPPSGTPPMPVRMGKVKQKNPGPYGPHQFPPRRSAVLPLQPAAPPRPRPFQK